VISGGNRTEQVRIALTQEILTANTEGLLQISQQLREATGILTINGHPLELDELAEVIEAIEVDPHAFKDEKASSLAHDNRDAEDRRESIPQLSGLAHLDQPIMALAVAGDIRALIGDQVGDRVGFLSKLEPSLWNFEIGVSLDQRSLVFCAEFSAHLDGSRRIAISRLQLQISARAPDAITLSARVGSDGMCVAV
jgi:hypothetical protein